MFHFLFLPIHFFTFLGRLKVALKDKTEEEIFFWKFPGTIQHDVALVPEKHEAGNEVALKKFKFATDQRNNVKWTSRSPSGLTEAQVEFKKRPHQLGHLK